MLYTRVSMKPFSGGAALGGSQVEAVTSEVECKLRVAWDKLWSALSSGGWVLRALQLGIASLSDVSAHQQKLVW